MDTTKICYACPSALVPGYMSTEHIFNSCVGGILTSKQLLCVKCNNWFGQKYEDVFAKQMSFFSGRVGLHKVRGGQKTYKTREKNSGYLVEIDKFGKISLAQTILKEMINTESGKRFSYVSPNNKKAQQKLVNQLKKKFGKEKIRDIVITESLENAEIDICGQLGGLEFLKTAQKSILNFYLHSGGQRNHVASEIEELFKTDNVPSIWFCPGSNPKPSIANLAHTVGVFARKDERILFGFIEYFGGIRLLGILNENYDGPDFSSCYAEDPIQGRPLDCSVQVPASRDELIEIVSKREIDYEEFSTQLSAIELAVRSNQYYSKIIEEVFERVFSRYPNAEYITVEIVNELSNELVEEMMPAILAASEQRRLLARNSQMIS